MIFFVSLERVDVEHRVFPGETCRLECVLDRVSLGVVRGDDLELSALLDVPCGYEDCSSDFALVLRRTRTFNVSDGFLLGGSCAYRPTETRLELLSVPHVREAATGRSVDCVSS